MCTTCGCSDSAHVLIDDAPMDGGRQHVHAHRHGHSHEHTHAHGDHTHDHDHEHDHHHDAHGHHHHHAHDVPPPDDAHGRRTIALEQEILAKNSLLAERNRGWLAGREVFAVNLMSSPGAGKTTLLERTVRDFHGPVSVIEGDQATSNDAERIRTSGCKVVQINTGAGCHLDAEMVANGLARLQPAANSLLFVENVGNLVCPALFDLGEGARVVIFSVTEGEDKPSKYPHMFQSADLVLLSKVDLLPHLDFDLDKALAQVQLVNPGVAVLQVSARTGVGLQAWYGWLGEHSAHHADSGLTA